MDVHRIAAHARTHVLAHRPATTAAQSCGAVEVTELGGRPATDSGKASSEAAEQSSLEGPSSQPGQTGHTGYLPGSTGQLPKAVRPAWNGCY